jgi:ribosomal protein L7/L12
MERGEHVAVPEFVPAPAIAQPPEGKMAEIERLARAGQLIMAIKAYRELTGVGLKDAKEAVERIRDGGH